MHSSAKGRLVMTTQCGVCTNHQLCSLIEAAGKNGTGSSGGGNGSAVTAPPGGIGPTPPGADMLPIMYPGGLPGPMAAAMYPGMGGMPFLQPGMMPGAHFFSNVSNIFQHPFH